MTTDHAPAAATTDNITTLRTAYAAFAAGDVAVVLGVMDPDVEWTAAAGGPYPGTFRGPQATAENVFARLGSEWSEFRVEPEEYIGSGDRIAVLGTYRGTYRATGKAATARFVHVYSFRDGRVARFEQVADTAMLNSALS